MIKGVCCCMSNITLVFCTELNPMKKNFTLWHHSSKHEVACAAGFRFPQIQPVEVYVCVCVCVCVQREIERERGEGERENEKGERE